MLGPLTFLETLISLTDTTHQEHVAYSAITRTVQSSCSEVTHVLHCVNTYP